MKYYLVSVLLLISLANHAQEKKHPIPKGFIETKNQKVAVYDFNGLEYFLHQENDTVYIINFWATWCIPCVQELPYFEQLLEKYSTDKLSIKLISLDFPKRVDKSLIPFMNKRKLKNKVILLDDKNANEWIDKVNPNWSGAIPATIIYNSTKRSFHESSFDFKELESLYLQFKKK
jgi:thiol-disulfide isomerase/thioredoxin